MENRLRMDINLRGMQDSNRFADTGAIGSAIAFDPTQPVRTGSSDDEYGGYFAWLGASGGPIGIAPANPVALIEQRRDKSTVHRALGNLQVASDIRVLDDADFEISSINPMDPRGIGSDYDQRKVY